MAEAIVIPPIPEIIRRAERCQDELRALKKMLKLATQAKAAEEARKARPGIPTNASPPEGGDAC